MKGDIVVGKGADISLATPYFSTVLFVFLCEKFFLEKLILSLFLNYQHHVRFVKSQILRIYKLISTIPTTHKTNSNIFVCI